MYKSPQSKIGSITETVISIGLDFEYSFSSPIILIALDDIPVSWKNPPFSSKGHMFNSLSGFFKTSPKTMVPKKSEITTGNKNTTKTIFLTAKSKLRIQIPLYLFSDDQIVQDN
jgi:hypothetical protein